MERKGKLVLILTSQCITAMNDSYRNNRWIDLHTHTDRSDGTLSPQELVNLAEKNDISILSITDHDTVAGIQPAINHIEAKNHTINIIKGIELSAKSARGVLHILGYHIDIHNEALLQSLEQFRRIRARRNNEIVDKLHSLGFDISMDDFKEVSKHNQSLGRPHIARILVEKNIVDSIDQAFDEYLGKNKKAYVPKKLYTAEKAISLIHDAGGLAFVAHPGTLRREGDEFEEYLLSLKGYGLNGIEVFAPLHNKLQIDTYLKLSKKHDLMISAGSDFHGANKPSIKLGICTDGQKIEINEISPSLYSENALESHLVSL